MRNTKVPNQDPVVRSEIKSNFKLTANSKLKCLFQIS